MAKREGEPEPALVGAGAAVAACADADAPFMPLRHPPFALYWLARIFSVVAYAGQGVAVGWHLYALTGDVFDLGLLGLAQFAPTVVLNLAVGHAADRFSRKRIAALCQFLQCLLVKVAARLFWVCFNVFDRQPYHTCNRFQRLRLYLSGRVFQVRVNALK